MAFSVSILLSTHLRIVEAVELLVLNNNRKRMRPENHYIMIRSVSMPGILRVPVLLAIAGVAIGVQLEGNSVCAPLAQDKNIRLGNVETRPAVRSCEACPVEMGRITAYL